MMKIYDSHDLDRTLVQPGDLPSHRATFLFKLNILIYNNSMNLKHFFYFNHIDNNMSKEKLKEIKSLYKSYHKQFWCHKKVYKQFKQINLLINTPSTSLIIIGTIVGGITLNPISLGIISRLGLLLKTFSEIKNYKKLSKHTGGFEIFLERE